MHNHSRIVRNWWGVFSERVLPVATQLCGPVLQRVSSTLQVGLQALAVLGEPDPSAPKGDFPQGCAVPRRPVKFWARRQLLGPRKPCRVPSTTPKPRRNPPPRRDALAHPAVVFLVAVPVPLVEGPGVRSGMIRRA